MWSSLPGTARTRSTGGALRNVVVGAAAVLALGAGCSQDTSVSGVEPADQGVGGAQLPEGGGDPTLSDGGDAPGVGGGSTGGNGAGAPDAGNGTGSGPAADGDG